jgi:hypothetical protein
MGVFSGLMRSMGYVRYSNGSNWYSVSKNNTTYINGKDKLQVSLDNSTLASVISIRADYLSKVMFYVDDENGDKNFDDPSLDFIKNPNPHQSTEDFLIQFEWFLCSYGWVYQRPYMNALQGTPKYIYNLNSSQIQFPNKMGNSLIITKKDERDYYNNEFSYSDVNDTRSIKFNDIIPFFDVSNSTDNSDTSAVTSPSRLDSIIKEASNISLASDAENVVIQTNGREMMFVDQQGNNLGGTVPMTNDDKENIQKILNSKYLMRSGGSRTLTPSKKMGWVNMSVKLGDLGLNESRETNSNIVAQRFQVPNEIYKAFTKGDTFENQKQAELGFIQNVIQPRANNIASSWTDSFGNQDRPFKASFEHLPTMQITEDLKADRALKITTSVRNLIQSGLTEEQAIQFMGNVGIKFDI